MVPYILAWFPLSIICVNTTLIVSPLSEAYIYNVNSLEKPQHAKQVLQLRQFLVFKKLPLGEYFVSSFDFPSTTHSGYPMLFRSLLQTNDTFLPSIIFHRTGSYLRQFTLELMSEIVRS